MSYLTLLKMISLEILKNPENDQTNLWPKCNLMALDRIMDKRGNKF